MLVTFISECQKGALKKTRKVLDSFAERIGTNVWKTIITKEGLNTVEAELKKNASKSTAIACHYHRSRTRTELLWTIGKKDIFDDRGQVPVNLREENIYEYKDKYQWKYLDIIQSAVAIAGLFHDYGKANDLFQNKLDPNEKSKIQSEPLRHEWISLLLYDVFISGCNSDQQWLDRLENITQDFHDYSIKSLKKLNLKKNPDLNRYPNFARLVAWLIVSHHRLPVIPDINDLDIKYVDDWLSDNFKSDWNSPQVNYDLDRERWDKVKTFSCGLPHLSPKWRRRAMEYAEKAKKSIDIEANSISLLDQRFTAHISRLCLMLGDHYYSQGPANKEYQSGIYLPIANTDKFKQPKQKLDEHLVGVAIESSEIAKSLPKYINSMPELDVPKDSLLNQRIPSSNSSLHFKYGWQNQTIQISKKIRKESKELGFFGVNMASTGKGKTIANAKIMNALESSRFNVAIGLRTLTLQTGTSFQNDLKLDPDQVTILVGGVAVKDLYDLENNDTNTSIDTGSESADSLLDLHIHCKNTSSNIHPLYKWTQHDDKIEKLLRAPILVSTIDHLIPATDGIRGGKQIGPILRLLTSDLILDEPDDFGLEDLPALCRLVNWAGVLGRKVLLSSATMPPALVNALFQAYRSGRIDYLEANSDNSDTSIACAWFDEFKSEYSIISEDQTFTKKHQNYCKNRILELKKSIPGKRGELLNVIRKDNVTSNAEILSGLAECLMQGILKLHSDHHIINENHKVSIGLIRMANIDPLVAISKELIKTNTDSDTKIHYCVYHSRFPLAIRSYLENKLDRILKRTEDVDILDHDEIKDIIDRDTHIKNHIFVVLASPVAEVGRDHDYDWAIAEPSSMRSIIQLAGRVLRHRPDKKIPEDKPNILIWEKNYKGLKGVSPCFTKPGFEDRQTRLSDSDLKKIMDESTYKVIDSCERIRSSIKRDSNDNMTLGDLEHKATNLKLVRKESFANKWWQSNTTWTGNLQMKERFRKSQTGDRYCLIMDHDEALPVWHQINPKAVDKKKTYARSNHINEIKDLNFNEGAFWLDIAPDKVMNDLFDKLNAPETSFKEMTMKYGEITIINYSENQSSEWKYHPQLGVFNEI